ncbi:MAG: hypothetical protein F6J92_39545 [Symploca sp. SIO1A3]|nr:hypothetical protein [Symploca sp. SIO1A3]
MDRETKGKLRRIWFARSLLGLGVFVALGFSIRQVSVVRIHTATHKQTYEQFQKQLLLQEQKQLQLLLQEQKQLQELEQQLQLLKLSYERLQFQKQKSNQAWLFLGLSVLGFITLLLLLLRQQNQVSLTLTGQLFLPEECIADLEALHQRMKSQQCPLWFIQLRMLQEIVELLWAFQIHIRIENFWLPGKSDSIDE